VRHDAVPEEGVRPVPRAVDELVGHDDVPRGDLLAEAPDRAHRDDPFRAELLERVDVGAEVEVAREHPVPAPVPRQEGEARPGEPAEHDLVGGVAEGRRDAPPLHDLEAGKLVEPAAADHAERAFRHVVPSCRGGRAPRAAGTW
jgi:hypothetical protein